MKKITLILVTLFVATFTNAQIILEHTFENVSWYKLPGLYNPESCELEGDIISVFGDANANNERTYQVYDANDFSLLGTFLFNYQTSRITITRNIFTNDNRIVILEKIKANNHIFIHDLAGNIIHDFGTAVSAEIRKWFDGSYKLVIIRETTTLYNIEIYSLPGDGSAQTTSTPSVPIRSSSARKIVRDGQVFVETENNTYSIQGQDVR